MRLLVAGGGTGGHIYPALSIIDAVRELEPKLEVLYAGTAAGLEADLVPRAGLPFQAISARGVMGKSPLQAVAGVLTAARGVLESLSLVRQFRPDVALGTGGYVCGPVLLAAWLHGVPVAIQEQNAFPGMTNRLLSRLADVVFAPFPPGVPHFAKARRVVLTGNPVRREVIAADRTGARQALGLSADDRLLFVFGGSRGAARIHAAMAEALPELERRPALGRLRVLYVTGRDYHDGVLQVLGSRGVAFRVVTDDAEGSTAGAFSNGTAVAVAPYLYHNERALAAADLALVRAGAMTVAELAALGLPAVIVPSPNVANNHQECNARVLSDAGAAVLVPDAQLTGDRLLHELERLLADPGELAAMAGRGRALGRPDAAAQIAREIIGLACRSRRGRGGKN